MNLGQNAFRGITTASFTIKSFAGGRDKGDKMGEEDGLLYFGLFLRRELCKRSNTTSKILENEIALSLPTILIVRLYLTIQLFTINQL